MARELVRNNSIEAKIYHQRLASLFKYLFISQPANILCATLAFIILYGTGDNFTIVSWYIACILISIIRFLASKEYLLCPSNYKLHLNIFIIGTAISAALWGVAGSFLMPSDDIFKQMIIILIITGITAGGLQTLQASFAAGFAFIVFSILPLAIWVFLQSEYNYNILGFLISIYLISMSIIAWRNSKILMEIIGLRYENFTLIKSLESTNAKLKYVSTHDSLTSLPNRTLFDEIFTAALIKAKKSNEKLAILFVDIDHFKHYNDKYGHDAGDSLLIQTADKLTLSLDKKHIVARVGGDEFVVLLINIKDKSDIEMAVQKILMEFNAPIIFEKHQFKITLSIGISIYPDNRTEKKLLLKAADMALYKAKLTGRNRHQYFSD